VTVVFSTSSPVASVAVFDSSNRILGHRKQEAPMAASGACLRMLGELLQDLQQVKLFVANVGPGSFTGVKVGVTLAKTLAFTCGVEAAGILSFDLISPSETVAIPSKKGEWLVRKPGAVPEKVHEFPTDALGYGPEVSEPRFPDASLAGALLKALKPVEAELLLPMYLAEPSISTPKKPYAKLITEAGAA
jgi:tRNA threonylcarbamoyladenosine biosynthesis protein TsaB